MNDFPVLKAFQEYIDAEQAKARKRMFGLSIFFIVLLVVVVVTFTIVITSVISRNQSLSDRLLDIALREKNPAQPVVNVQQPAPVPVPVVQPHPQSSSESAELARLREDLQREKDARQADQAKRDKEKIESLTAQLAKAQQQPVAPAPVVVTTTPASVVQPAESAELVRLREELRREKEARKAEQDKREKEKKEAEKEAFLRRQYPAYYAKEDARKATVHPSAAQPAVQPEPVTMPNSTELNRQRKELDREEKEEKLRRIPAPKPSPSQKIPPTPSPKAVKAITYFDESQPSEDPELKELLNRPPSRTAPKAAVKPAPQPAAKPVPKPSAQPAATQPAAQKTVQSPHKTETLAIGGAADGGSIPWLIELPVQQP